MAELSDWLLDRGKDLLDAGIRAKVDNPYNLNNQRMVGDDGTPYTEGQPTAAYAVIKQNTGLLVVGGLAAAALLLVLLKS